jgi:hypothetical protein
VSWQAAEISSPSEKFEVQRAARDMVFETIGTVAGSDMTRFYNYTDNDLKSGINFYRLKMTDKDGRTTYTRTAAIMNGVDGLLITSLAPTIVNNTTTLTVSSSRSRQLEIVVTDMQGRAMLRRNFTVAAGNTNIELSMARLESGAYLLTGISDEGRISTIRFIKQ